MNEIVLVAKQPSTFATLADHLEKHGRNRVRRLASSKDLLAVLAEHEIDVVIAAEQLADSDGLSCIREVGVHYPQVNTGLINTLATEDFHAITEGLGLFLQLPREPGKEEAEKIMEFLDSIQRLSSEYSRRLT